MNNNIHLKIEGSIQPESARWLERFFKDWAYIKTLRNLPDNPILAFTYQNLEHIFVPDGGLNPDSARKIQKNILHLDTSFKTNGTDIEYFITTFLPHVLLELTEGSYRIENEQVSFDLTFDSKNKLISTKPKENPIDTETIEQDNAEWEEENGDVTPYQWRRNLAEFLKVTSDIKRQEKLFTSDEDNQLGLSKWFDLTAFYFTSLNLENGMNHALSKNFLSQKESETLREFDKKFRNYLPDDNYEDDKDLSDPEWIEITELAKELCLSLVPLLEKKPN